MSRLTRDGTAKPVSRNQILWRDGGKEIFPVQLTINRIGNLTQLICTLLYAMTAHAYVYYTVACTLNSRLLSGHLEVVASASGIYSSRPLWYSYFRMCLEKIERNCLTSYLNNAAILVSFFLFACFKACFRLSLSTRNKNKRTVTSKKHAYRPETSYCVYYSLKYHVVALYL